jgi:hypothetical protein
VRELSRFAPLRAATGIHRFCWFTMDYKHRTLVKVNKGPNFRAAKGGTEMMLFQELFTRKSSGGHQATKRRKEETTKRNDLIVFHSGSVSNVVYQVNTNLGTRAVQTRYQKTVGST